MTHEQLQTILAAIPTSEDDDGWAIPDEARHLTLYLAHDGVQLTIGKVEAVRGDSELLRARTRKGEVYLVNTEDLFAVAVDIPAEEGRRAGFSSR